MPKQKKNPWISAILNLLFGGIGYIYNGKRVGFGFGVFIADALLTWSFIRGEWTLLYTLSITIIDFMFAYDGYKEAKEMNRTK